jgi:rhomboid family GlyGly-CTERM serine protease
MNALFQSTSPRTASGVAPRNLWRKPGAKWLGDRTELVLFLVLTAIFSVSVFVGSPWQGMMFNAEAVRAGEWWRLVTHPFVHVTWYHLLLDGAAFGLLYHGLIESSRAKRLGYVVASATASLLLAWLAAPLIYSTGLCGLSGIAHGLMAVSAVEMMRGQSPRSSAWRIGALSFLIVVAKSAYEAITGKILFAFLYFGMVGDPVTVSHAGGIVGALALMLVLGFRKRPAAHWTTVTSTPTD